MPWKRWRAHGHSTVIASDSDQRRRPRRHGDRCADRRQRPSGRARAGDIAQARRGPSRNLVSRQSRGHHRRCTDRTLRSNACKSSLRIRSPTPYCSFMRPPQSSRARKSLPQSRLQSRKLHATCSPAGWAGMRSGRHARSFRKPAFPPTTRQKRRCMPFCRSCTIAATRTC